MRWALDQEVTGPPTQAIRAVAERGEMGDRLPHPALVVEGDRRHAFDQPVHQDDVRLRRDGRQLVVTGSG